MCCVISIQVSGQVDRDELIGCESNLMVGMAVENRRHSGVEVVPQKRASGLLMLFAGLKGVNPPPKIRLTKRK